jgi:hypothetical protein
MPTNYIKVSSNWKPISQFWLKVSSNWKSVSQGWINVAGIWRQFFGATNAYVFNFGNTVHVGTNGYISFDGGQSAISIASTVDRVLGILPADLEMNSVRWAASSSRFYIFWRGKRFSVGSDFEIEYEVHFINGQDYALIKLVAFPSSTYSLTGYYYNGSSTGNSRITTTRTVGAEYRVYFNTTTAFATTFTEFGAATHPVWLASSSVTSGSNDDGYFSIVANQGSSSEAPTSVTASSITATSATVSWTAPLRESRGMSAIQSYDYSINGGSSWTSTSTNTSVDLTGLTASTSYTVLVRANNYYFTGTNYGSVTFSTTAPAPTPNITLIEATGLGNISAPYIRFRFTSTDAASLSIMLYRSATSSTGPWTALSARLTRETTGVLDVDFSSRTGTTSNWYYVDVIPYSGSSATGTAGTLRTSSVRRGTQTATVQVYP